MTETPPIPATLSALIRLAVADARALDREKYKPISSLWHCSLGPSEPCAICDAGAVIAGTLGMTGAVLPSDCGTHWTHALYALDWARRGDIRSALRHHALAKGDHLPSSLTARQAVEASIEKSGWLPLVTYHGWDDFEEHLEVMIALADLLEARGY